MAPTGWPVRRGLRDASRGPLDPAAASTARAHTSRCSSGAVSDPRGLARNRRESREKRGERLCAQTVSGTSSVSRAHPTGRRSNRSGISDPEPRPTGARPAATPYRNSLSNRLSSTLSTSSPNAPVRADRGSLFPGRARASRETDSTVTALAETSLEYAIRSSDKRRSGRLGTRRTTLRRSARWCDSDELGIEGNRHACPLATEARSTARAAVDRRRGDRCRLPVSRRGETFRGVINTQEDIEK